MLGGAGAGELAAPWPVVGLCVGDCGASSLCRCSRLLLGLTTNGVIKTLRHHPAPVGFNCSVGRIMYTH